MYSKTTGRRLAGHMVVVSHKIHERAPSGAIAVSGGFPLLKNEFCRNVEHVTLCVPIKSTYNQQRTVNYEKNLTLSPLIYYRNRFGFLLNLPRNALRIWRLIRRADLVYAMCPNDMGILGLAIARFQGKPVFVSIDTDRAGKARASPGSKIRTRSKAWLIEHTVHSALRLLAGRIPAYVTGNDFLGENRYWSQWIKTTIRSQDVPALMHSSNIELKHADVVFAGRLSLEKNIGTLIEVVNELIRNGVQISLTIYGDGPERTALQEKAGSNLQSRILFKGYVSSEDLLKTRFFGADILVLPSREERQGKVLLEAMACSIPVIAARAGGIPSVVTEDYNGLLFNPDDPAELYVQINRLISLSGLRRKIIENGYHFSSMHTLDQTVADIVKQVADFYKFRYLE